MLHAPAAANPGAWGRERACRGGGGAAGQDLGGAHIVGVPGRGRQPPGARASDPPPPPLPPPSLPAPALLTGSFPWLSSSPPALQQQAALQRRDEQLPAAPVPPPPPHTHTQTPSSQHSPCGGEGAPTVATPRPKPSRRLPLSPPPLPLRVLLSPRPSERGPKTRFTPPPQTHAPPNSCLCSFYAPHNTHQRAASQPPFPPSFALCPVVLAPRVHNPRRLDTPLL